MHRASALRFDLKFNTAIHLGQIPMIVNDNKLPISLYRK